MSQPTAYSAEIAERVGLELQIETPENVVLTYQLAGPAARCGAYLLDLLIRIGLFFVLSIVFTVVGIALPGMGTGLTLLALFFLEFGYYVVCEGLFNGKTLGKRAFGLRVIQEQGYPMTFWSALLRNLLRAADAIPLAMLYGTQLPLFQFIPLYGPGFLSMLLSGKHQRLGDLAARTVVIQERRVILPREPVIVEKIHPLSRDELGGFIPGAATLSLIDEFLGRRHVLSHKRGHALARLLARALAQRLDFQGDPNLVEQYPMAFLARVYVTFIRRRDEDDGLRNRIRLHPPQAAGAPS